MTTPTPIKALIIIGGVTLSAELIRRIITDDDGNESPIIKIGKIEPVGRVAMIPAPYNAPHGDSDEIVVDILADRADIHHQRTVDALIKNDQQPVDDGGYIIPERAAPYADRIHAAANRHRVPAPIIFALLNAESAYRDDIISGDTQSPAGAKGIAQIMDATAQEFNVDPLDVDGAINFAGEYIRYLLDYFNGDITLALAGYNWGLGNVTNKGIENAPRETREYITKIYDESQADSITRNLFYSNPSTLAAVGVNP